MYSASTNASNCEKIGRTHAGTMTSSVLHALVTAKESETFKRDFQAMIDSAMQQLLSSSGAWSSLDTDRKSFAKGLGRDSRAQGGEDQAGPVACMHLPGGR